MTPEAVIYRYLELASRRAVPVDALVRLLGADADLLGRWLNLLACPAEPDALQAALAELTPAQLRTLAQAQASAVLPVAGSARLGIDQWQSVLRSAFLAELIAEQLGLKDAPAVRWRVLLAVSGVNLPHDAEVKALGDFRGVRPELLDDAGTLIKIFAVVDALEVLDEMQAAALAERLLAFRPDNLAELTEWAGGRANALVAELELTVDADADWAHRLWIQHQVSLLTELLGEALEDGHALASRSLFQQVPLLLLRSGDVLVAAEEDIRIRLESEVSEVAATLRVGESRVVRDTADTAVAERQLLRQLGSTSALCVPLRSGEEPLGALLFVVDEDVDQELTLRLYADQLAERLAQRLEEADRTDQAGELLRHYRLREEKRLRELVHEVNNPLSVVHNYLHILELRLQHEPSATEQLQMISSELKRAGEILQRVRELSPVGELEASSADVVFAEFDVNDLIRRVYELHRGYADDRDVELSLRLPQGQVVLASDEQRLAQILNNLVRNAIEASAGETVSLDGQLGVFREGREGVELSVRDTGPGLSRAVLERLADPKDSSKGGDHQGLGLHIVHRLVGELQGSIDVRTAPGVGTTFTVFLPLTPL